MGGRSGPTRRIRCVRVSLDVWTGGSAEGWRVVPDAVLYSDLLCLVAEFVGERQESLQTAVERTGVYNVDWRSEGQDVVC